MLFNSYAFILFYLPITVVMFFAIARWNHRLAASWLLLASLFFYAWWDPRFVGLLLGSIAFNYLAGVYLANEAHRARRAVLIGAVSGNLMLLAYFKYTGFLLGTVNHYSGLAFPIPEIILPLGISFFTFTQLAFLVDAHRGIAKEPNLIHYGLFVTYFPHLIAGPVLHHKQMMPQFAKHSTYSLNWDDVSVGLTVFVIGLFKKTVLADSFADYSSPMFESAAGGKNIPFFSAWAGVLAYTLQLYFDFSGYSDMALGLSRILGVRLPLNFDSPYKATSIIDFWRRWHMTLSQFLRDYLYISLGGNRHGAVRRYINLFLTMLLGGLWHGAGWTFVVWGALHGLFLAINQLWRSILCKIGKPNLLAVGPGRYLAGATTFLSVVFAWVFFRAADLDSASRIIKGMLGLRGFIVDPSIYDYFDLGNQDWAKRIGVFVRRSTDPMLQFERMKEAAVLLIGLLICWLMPNTQEIILKYRSGIDESASGTSSRLNWQPRLMWLTIILTMGVLALPERDRVSEFLYFQF